MTKGSLDHEGVPAGRQAGEGHPDHLAVVQPLWAFLAVSYQPRRADVIFVFGSQDLAVPSRAAELYHAGHASRVLVTGSFGRMTRDVFEKAEALVFQDHLVSAGVPESAIVAEPDASNTLENVTFGMTALDRAGVRPRSALLVGKGFVMRRCLATFARHHADVDVRACPPTDDVRRAADRSPEAFAARLVAELARLDRYGAQGDIVPQDVPAEVREVASRLSGRIGR